MTYLDKDGMPNWTQGNPEWAFNKETVSQLSGIAAQLERMSYTVESKILFNNEEKIKNEGPNLSVKEYQDCIDGIAIVAEESNELFEKQGYGKKVVIETNVDEESMHLQVGFQDKNDFGDNRNDTDLWNNGIYYSQIFAKDELGKFSNLWDRILTVFINNPIIPIREKQESVQIRNKQRKSKTTDVMDKYFQLFIEDGLRKGYVKKLRKTG